MHGSAHGVGKVRAYKRDVVPGRVGGLHMASEERGLYRLRTASDIPYSGAYTYGGRETFAHKLGAALIALVRLAASTIVLLAWVAAVWLYRDTPVELLQDGSAPWLTASQLLIPIGFFLVFLTNRRYGPAYAFAQVVLAAIAVVSFILFSGSGFNQYLPLDTIPPVREAAAFGGAFFAATFVSTVVFDGARGPNWWTAPLFGFFSAAIVYGASYFAALYAGTEASWLVHGSEYMGVLAVEGMLLLIPFWALRRMVPPMSGFGGY